MSEINPADAPPVAKPPHEWEIQTFALMVAAGCAAGLGILLLVSDLAVRAYLLTGGADGVSALVAWILDNGDAISALYLMLGFGYLIGFFIWRRRTRALLDSVGEANSPALWHWTVGAWYLGLFTSFMIRANNPAGTPAQTPLTFGHDTSSQAEQFASWLAWDAAQIGARLIGLTFLLIAVWQIRTQVRERVAASGVIFRIRDIAPRPSAVPLPAAARPVPVGAQPSGLPMADEDFWGRVAALATGRRAEVAMLETTDGLARRWLVVPESGDLGVVRSTVAPGAVVTAFPESPDAGETKGFSPRPAEEYHGFLEDTESGAVWYQSVKPNRVGAFLARARRARRWALYPADSPEALTAVVPWSH
ncbi:hypothetical protein ODJ79_35545 [Actinoplanes sp. KI2]|uniref:hypothetical protein n=1 Tax=Actinoplanes sp. KI2 TaxID=2983315 RepID=UPI0021D59E2C|nr:hypothetical protein [Actinoplanes sp. KI2]MCU7729058.1 hypothetical protein [Actinoplanes sp. KI2]